MNRISTDILIVGGGAAGMSAALAASTHPNAGITLVDDNPFLGGQIWRAELGKTKSSDAAKLIDAVTSGRISIVNNAQVFDAHNSIIVAETPDGRIGFEYKKIIIATGARERFLAFPGWTLPNVLGAGGLQALVKGGLNIEGKRIVVAGTGPLLLAVAEYLKSKGGNVLLIAEQASKLKLCRFGLSLISAPTKAIQAFFLRQNLRDTHYLNGCWVMAAHGDDKLGSVTLNQNRQTWDVPCDYLACGFHLVPNVELAVLLGSRIEHGFVAVDDFQRTSCENVFCAGEPTGIGGVEASLIEGSIAGLAATGELEAARELFARRRKTAKFTVALNRAFALRRELKTLADDETIVCRCEDVTFGRLREFDSRRTAKLQTRCGMGACQGRICGAATEFLFDWEDDMVRPPIFPVKLENL